MRTRLVSCSLRHRQRRLRMFGNCSLPLQRSCRSTRPALDTHAPDSEQAESVSHPKVPTPSPKDLAAARGIPYNGCVLRGFDGRRRAKTYRDGSCCPQGSSHSDTHRQHGGISLRGRCSRMCDVTSKVFLNSFLSGTASSSYTI